MRFRVIVWGIGGFVVILGAGLGLVKLLQLRCTESGWPVCASVLFQTKGSRLSGAPPPPCFFKPERGRGRAGFCWRQALIKPFLHPGLSQPEFFTRHSLFCLKNFANPNPNFVGGCAVWPCALLGTKDGRDYAKAEPNPPSKQC